MSSTYGEKLSDTKITLQHVAGTQTIKKGKNSTGTSTASMAATSKFLQEIHTMLLNGVEEFMRHASKNTALGMSVDGSIQTYNGKKENKKGGGLRNNQKSTGTFKICGSQQNRKSLSLAKHYQNIIFCETALARHKMKKIFS